MKQEIHNRYREEEKEQSPDKTKEEKIEIIEEEEEDEVTQLENEIVDLKKQIADLNDKYLRTHAEHENFKKRMTEERIKDRMYANQSILEAIINVTDIFDQAVNIETDDEKLANFLVGFKMINKNINQVLENEGVKRIHAVGSQFDARYHMAVETDYDPTKDDNIVLEEIQSGYIFKDRILRPSRVKVNKKQGGNNNE